MSLDPTQIAWAKRGLLQGQPAFHPLRHHLLDAAAVARVFAESVLSPSIKSLLMDQTGLMAENLQNLLVFLAASHDIGKLTPAFQSKDTDRYRQLLSSGLPDVTQALSANTPHGTQSARILRRYLQSSASWIPDHAIDIGSVVGGHHGSFISFEDMDEDRWNAVDLGKGPWMAAQTRLLAEIRDTLQITSLPRPTRLPTVTLVLLAGFVSICDWVASNEDFFPYLDATGDAGAYFRTACKGARFCLAQLGWLPRPSAAPVQSYAELFPIEQPSPLQERLLDLAQSASGPGLYLVEAPMGDGKTEAACAAAEHLCHSQELNGLYFALPTQATSDQMFGRVTAMLERRGAEHPQVIALLHGQASLSREYEQLRRLGREYFRFSGVGGFDKEPAVVAGDWFAQSKRGLLAPYGVGTIDQSLMAVLGSRHFFVRLFGLAGKALIIDEVHAYDTYMGRLLERLLTWAASLRTPVILLSATLPASRSKALLSAYQEGLGVPQQQVTRAEYPRVTVAGAHPISNHVRPRCASRRIALRHLEVSHLMPALHAALDQGGNIAIICNTVEKARQTYCLIRKFYPGEADLLHSRYLVKDKQERLHRALGRVSRNSPRPHRSILVATQIIEQSLDLDFDLLVTEMPPVDLLLQRIGRVHRHKRDPHPSFPAPACWILEPPLSGAAPRFGNSARVYDEHILLRTWLHLRERQQLQIPDEIDALIEAVYGAATVPKTEEIAVLWQKTRVAMEASIQAEESAAREAYLRPPTHDNVMTLVRNSADSDEAIAGTRLLRPSASLIALYQDQEGGLSFDAAGADPISTSNQPTLDETSRLLEHSVTLPLRRSDQVPKLSTLPKAWQSRAALSRMELLSLGSDAQGRLGNLSLRLDQDLGLIRIER